MDKMSLCINYLLALTMHVNKLKITITKDTIQNFQLDNVRIRT